MVKVTDLESGHDFITLYFEKHNEMSKAGERLYKYFKRINFQYLDLQRKNMVHKPGDIPHFHNGTPATKGPHIHIRYPHRPTIGDWWDLEEILKSRLVDIQLDSKLQNQEIS